MTAPRRAATIEDVARAAGVSRAAVSKVLRNAYGVSEAMRARVEAAMSELAYRPRVSARAMRGSTYTLGISMPWIDSSFFADIFSGIEDELVGSQFRTILASSIEENHDHSDQIQNLIDRQVDGLIVVGAALDHAVLEDLGQRLPLVVLGRVDASSHYDTVVGDDRIGAGLVMDHLFAAGHQHIAHLTQYDRGEQLPGTSHRIRRETYEQAMVEHQLTPVLIAARFDESTAYVATASYLQSNPIPTAIFAGADEAAFGVLHALSDIGTERALATAVVGYDNTRFARHPRFDLSSVDQRGRELGRRAAAMVFERLDDREAPLHEVLTPRLFARSSSAGAPWTSGRSITAS